MADVLESFFVLMEKSMENIYKKEKREEMGIIKLYCLTNQNNIIKHIGWSKLINKRIDGHWLWSESHC